LLRPTSNQATPCYRCPKLSDDDKKTHRPHDPKWFDWARSRTLELSAKNWSVYLHYRTCKAIGQFPNDPIVRMHAAIIAAVEERFHQSFIANKLDKITMILMGKFGL
jgi:hypothetical protein